MQPEVTPWLMIASFVAALAATIIIGLRALLSGKIVAGRHYDDALRREVAWKRAAEMALAASAEAAAHMGRMVVVQEQLAATTRDTQALVRQLLAPGERAA